MAIAPIAFVAPSAGTAAAPAPASGAASAGTTSFSNLIDRFLDGATQSRNQADTAVRDLALGRTDNLHEVMLQVAQADLSFRLILEIRNRLTETYQDIMKMQV